jgi:hypothetical protein
MDKDQEEKIRLAAYNIWKLEGQPENLADVHWEKAKREVLETEKSSKSKLRRFTIDASTATVIAAFLTVFGGITGALINGLFNKQQSIGSEEVKSLASIKLENAKLQTNLIIKAIDTTDQDKAIRALKFFAKAGLISDYKDSIINLTSEINEKEIPILGNASTQSTGCSFADFDYEGGYARLISPANRKVLSYHDYDKQKCIFSVDGAGPEAKIIKCDRLPAEVYVNTSALSSVTEEDIKCTITIN